MTRNTTADNGRIVNLTGIKHLCSEKIFFFSSVYISSAALVAVSVDAFISFFCMLLMK